MNRHPDRPVRLWLLAGLMAYLILPWYAIQDTAWYTVLGQVLGGPETASGLVQILAHHRVWLLLGVLGLVVAAIGLAVPPGKAQGRWFLAGGVLGFGGLLASGFMIGAKGWSFEILNRGFGELALNQFGIGIGAFVALLALVMIAAFGVARLGFFKGDLFVASAVVGCSVLLLLFIAFPVVKALHGAFLNEQGQWSLLALQERIGNERVWGLNCLAGGLRCGVAWNTLFLALCTATGTTVLGTMMALMAERSASARVQTPLRVVALLPIITPPFVVGLGLILLFGRAGVVNQFLEYAFGIAPTRWFYGVLGIWIAQMFAFTPIAFMIMRGVVQGVAPSLEEAAQTLRADRRRTFFTITLPLLKPGLANAFLGGFHREHGGISATRSWWAGSIRCCPPTSSLPSSAPSTTRGARHRWPGSSRCSRWASLPCSAACSGKQNYTTVSGKGDAGIPMALPDSVRRVLNAVVYPWLAFTVVVYLFAFAGGFVQTWGRDYTLTLQPLQDRLCAGVGPVRPRLGRHGLEFALHHGQAGRVVGPGHRRHRPADRLAAGAHRVSRARPVRVRGAVGLCDPGHRAGRELHPGLQRAAGRADPAPGSSSCCASCSATCRSGCARAQRPSDSSTSHWTKPR
jgi:iron(III) transport system permease protein